MNAQEIEQLLQPIAAENGCEIWGVELQAQGRHPLLRVFVERQGGATIDDCETISREAATLLDVEDPIDGAYTLEVSTPGIARTLFHLHQYPAYVGEKLKIRLRTNYEGRRNFTGQLAGVEAEDVVLRVGEDEFLFPHSSIERAILVPTYE